MLCERVAPEFGPKIEDMPRRQIKKRPAHGAHLASLRRAAGLTQTEFAALLGVPQSTVGFWETADKPPRSDVLPAMAKILGVSVETILAGGSAPQKRRGGPVGKLQRVFEDASQLPQSQQEKIVEVLQALITGFRAAD